MVGGQQFLVGDEAGDAQRDEGVDDGAADDGKQHEITGFAGREGELLRHLRDGVKAHI